MNTNLICRGPIIMALRRQVQPDVYHQVEKSLPSAFIYDSMIAQTSLKINGKEYQNALTASHGYCQVMFNVPDGVDRLIGRYYIPESETATEEKGQFHVYVDGQECFCSGSVTDKDPMGEFDVSLEGATTVLLAADSSDFYKALNFSWIEVQLLPGGKWLTELDLVNTVCIPIDATSLKDKDDLLPLSFAEPVDANWNIQLDAELDSDGENRIPFVLVPMAQVCYDEVSEKYLYEGFSRYARDYNCQDSQYRIFFTNQ